MRITKFESWIETEADFILITNREKEIARASWIAALIFVEQIINEQKEGVPNND